MRRSPLAFPPSRSRGRTALVWGLVSALVAIAVVAGALWYAPFLRVQQVEYRTEPARLSALEGAAVVRKGRPLVEVDTEAVRADAMRTLLFETVTVTRSWPSTVVVEAVPRRPVVAVRQPSGSGVRLVDRAGVGYEELPTAPDGVPVAEVEAQGGADDPATLHALASVVGGLDPELMSATSDVRVAPDGRITLTVEKTEVIWGDASDSRLKAAVVRDLVGRAGVARIDVSAPMAPVTTGRDGTSRPTVGGEGGTERSASPSSRRESGEGEQPAPGADGATSTADTARRR